MTRNIIPSPSSSQLATQNRVAVMYPQAEYVEAGRLFSYGVSIPDLFVVPLLTSKKFLQGAKPADLPVEQPTKFEFIVNLNAAKQIGLKIPPTVFARADKVIR